MLRMHLQFDRVNDAISGKKEPNEKKTKNKEYFYFLLIFMKSEC